MVKKIDSRMLIGVALILLGGLMLLERAGFFHGATDIFWGLVFLSGGAFFLYCFATHPQEEWWAAIPGFALAGLAAESLLPKAFGDLNGMFFLGALGLGFFAVYLSDRERWWAIIPGGVLLTLAIISVLTEHLGVKDTGAFLLIGLGVTFILVAILAAMRWAYIPGIALLFLGVFLGIGYTGSWDYLWPAFLIVAGLVFLWQFVRRK
jgi:hypothetical protein